MKTIDAINILTAAGYTVLFSSTIGAYVVTMWASKGGAEYFNRLDLVQLASDIEYLG